MSLCWDFRSDCLVDFCKACRAGSRSTTGALLSAVLLSKLAYMHHSRPQDASKVYISSAERLISSLVMGAVMVNGFGCSAV